MKWNYKMNLCVRLGFIVDSFAPSCLGAKSIPDEPLFARPKLFRDSPECSISCFLIGTVSSLDNSKFILSGILEATSDG